MMATNDRFNGVVASAAVKVPCVAVAIVNTVLSGEQTVNGVPVVAGDRVLATAQTSSVDNGIYEVSSSAWQRTDDFDGNRDALNGTLVVVAAPLVGFYQLTATDPVVIGTSALTFTVVTDIGLAANLALTTVGKGASLVGIFDVGSLIVATTVEAALQELATAIAAIQPTVGSFTPVWVGFSADPTGDIFWAKDGNIITLQFPVGAGTSNATDFAISNLPAALRPVTDQYVPMIALRDNSVVLGVVGGVGITPAGQANFSADGSGDTQNWTASGSKGFSLNASQAQYSIATLE